MFCIVPLRPLAGCGCDWTGQLSPVYPELPLVEATTSWKTSYPHWPRSLCPSELFDLIHSRAGTGHSPVQATREHSVYSYVLAYCFE